MTTPNRNLSTHGNVLFEFLNRIHCCVLLNGTESDRRIRTTIHVTQTQLQYAFTRRLTMKFVSAIDNTA